MLFLQCEQEVKSILYCCYVKDINIHVVPIFMIYFHEIIILLFRYFATSIPVCLPDLYEGKHIMGNLH